MTSIPQPFYYRKNTFEESFSLSTCISERKEWSRGSSFEESIAKKKPILKKQSSFPIKKKNTKSSKRLSFKKELVEVFQVESYKEFNVDVNDICDFMGFECKKTNCCLF